MKRVLTITADGSQSIFVEELNERYHSRHGAIQESAHVFLKMGLEPALLAGGTIRILEIGLGTGLNCLMTLAATENFSGIIEYVSLEAFPVEEELWKNLEYPEALQRGDLRGIFEKIHKTEWGKPVELRPGFVLEKRLETLESAKLEAETFQVIYFDAFAPEKQPELWTEDIFEKMWSCSAPAGQLVTYCAKGAVRRAMISAGFSVEKLPGPPGKREMLRATRSEASANSKQN